MPPRLSVLLPLYKPDPRYLAAAIESVQRQSMSDWELVAIEDPPASNAGEYLKNLRDSRIRHKLRATKLSLGDALNEGIELCSAPNIARMDADDICDRERFSIQLGYLDARTAVAAVGSSLTIIDRHERVIGHRRMPVEPGDVAAAMRRYNAIAHPSVMFRRDVIRKIGGYDAAARTEDYDLWCRLVTSGHPIANVREELLRYRFHERALKFDAVHDVIRATIATKEKYFRREFTMGDRLRLIADKSLLLLPPRLILTLFRATEY